MPTTFRPYDPDQMLLLPPSLRDWLPAGHLAEHVSDLVDGLDLSAFYERYEADGRRKPPYEPRMMLKDLIYGYATGLADEHPIARAGLEQDLDDVAAVAPLPDREPGRASLALVRHCRANPGQSKRCSPAECLP